MVSKEYYEDWVSDNHQQLKDDFVEDNIDEFTKFCESEFDEWRDK